jgi:hypothetical protein
LIRAKPRRRKRADSVGRTRPLDRRDPLVRLVTTVRFAMIAPPVPTAPRVMTELLERTALTVLRETSLPSATVDPSAKDATSMPRASLTVRFARPVTNDATTARRGTPVPSVMTVRLVMTVPREPTVFRGIRVPSVMTVRLVMTVARCATIAPHGMTVAPSETTADRGPIDFLVTRDPFATTVRHEMTVPRVTIVSLATNVPPAATRTSIRPATKRRFTNPATTSCSIACRRWPPLRRMSTE